MRFLRIGVIRVAHQNPKAGVLRLGTAVACSHCTKENWFTLNEFGETVRSGRCLKDYPIPRGTRPTPDTWKYRVVRPFATSGDTQGGYAVALTLGFLAHKLDSLPSLTWTTSLDLDADILKSHLPVT